MVRATLARRPVALGLLAASLAAFAASTLLRPAAGYEPILDAWLYNVPFVLAAGLALARARRGPDRAAWALLGAGLVCITAGNVYEALVLARLEDPPYPSPADAFWIAFYPLAYLTIILLARRRLTRIGAPAWLDGAVAALGVAALCATAVAAWFATATDGPTAVVITNIAFPAADVVLLAVVAGLLGTLGWRLSPPLLMIGAGLLVAAAADVLYLLAESSGTYVVGGPLDVGWPLAACLLGVAAVLPARAADRPAGPGGLSLAVPGVAAVGALAVLVWGQGGSVPPLAVGLAVAALVAALLRVGLSFRELRALADSRRQAQTDDLTGLPNRRAFSAHTARLLEGEGVARPMALLLIDLDRFKEVNDSLGHAVGDRLLTRVAERLRESVRPGDLLARLGGDEFALVLGGADRGRALALAERLRAVVARPVVVDDLTLQVGASVGISLGPEQAATADELLQRADVAMYAAKARRTGAEVYDSERDRACIERLETVQALRAAMGSGELEVHYQPEVQVETGAAACMEALVRWNRPGHGLLPPGRFIPLADQAGLMGMLTAVVLGDAVARCRAWRAAGHMVAVAVNVPASRLVDASLPDEVAAALADHGLPSEALVIEVTEDSAMTAPDRSHATLRRLRQLGVRVAVDDYGTGHSSLSYLRELPVTELKLDRSFVTRMEVDPHLAAIVRSTIGLAHALGLRVVAEGVESAGAMDLLAGFGCDLAQGYLIARPMQPDQVPGWLGAPSPVTDSRRAPGGAAAARARR